MTGTMRRVALATMVMAVALLIGTVATRDPTSDNSAASNSQSTPDATTTPLPTSTPTPNPFAVSSNDESLTISKLWSPMANTARAEGTMSANRLEVAVTVNGSDLGQVTLTSDPEGKFVIDIADLDPGPQEVCLVDACQRVLVADPTAEARSVIDARIDEARNLVEQRFDLAVLLPDWTIITDGPNSSAGGHTNADQRTIVVHANSGRTLDEYEITLLHEVGHAIDAQWLTPVARDEFRALRGHDPSLEWGVVDQFAVGDERWRNSAEDFSEVFVAWALANNYSIMSEVVAPQPSDDDLRTFCALIAADSPIECG